MLTPENKNKTIGTIFQTKFHNYIENETVWNLIGKIFLTFVSTLITLILTYPEYGILILEKIFLFQNMIFPKAFVVFYIIFNINTVSEYYQFIMGKATKSMKSFTFKKICKQKIEKNKEDLISGIPIVELLDYLFENKHFKRTEVEEKFSIPRNRFQELAEKMEQENILKRGENNSRILNDDFTRKQIARAFIFAEGEIKNLRIQAEETSPNSFTREPQSPALRDKMSKLMDTQTTA